MARNVAAQCPPDLEPQSMNRCILSLCYCAVACGGWYEAGVVFIHHTYHIYLHCMVHSAQ